jgi:heat shock protein HtpX
MKRIALLIATNLAVVLLLSAVIQVFGIDNYLTRRGINYQSLIIFAAVFGFGGAFFSLAISKWIAKRSMGVRVIAQPSSEAERWLVATVRSHAEKAGIGMPEVAVYDAPDMNAFATGMSRNSSLIAVSTGLLQSMDRNQVQAVLGHEITHVANGDMVTMGLIQGVLNTFVIFFARIIGTVVDNALSGNRNSESGGGGFFYFIIVTVLQVALGFLASLIVMWFSRWREFRADAGGARLGGRDNMISALQRLAGNQGETALPKAIQAFGISGQGGLSRLLMSHPPLEERIAALRAA